MKKKLLFVLVVLIPIILSGQAIKPGIFVGINLANWREDDVLFAEDWAYATRLILGSSDFQLTSEPRIGLSSGILVDFKLAKFLSLQPEISYSQKGAKFSGSGTITIDGTDHSLYADITMQLDYLDFVLNAKISLTKNKIKPYFITGLGLGYLVSSRGKEKDKIDGELYTESSKLNMFGKLDYHVNVGGGLDFSGLIRIEFRYYHFFNSVTEGSFSDYILLNSVKSISLIICF
jgi:hypothetical protein